MLRLSSFVRCSSYDVEDFRKSILSNLDEGGSIRVDDQFGKYEMLPIIRNDDVQNVIAEICGLFAYSIMMTVGKNLGENAFSEIERAFIQQEVEFSYHVKRFPDGGFHNQVYDSRDSETSNRFGSLIMFLDDEKLGPKLTFNPEIGVFPQMETNFITYPSNILYQYSMQKGIGSSRVLFGYASWKNKKSSELTSP